MYTLVCFIYREYTKKIDPDLPYYHPTGSERYKEEEPNFDEPSPDGKAERLHTVKRRRREDGSLFVAGRQLLPSGQPSLRNQFHKFGRQMPPVPDRLVEQFLK